MTEQQKYVASATQVFLTREQLAERWHCKPDTITRTYRKLGLRKVPLNGRWLVSLEQVQEIERKKMAAALK